MSAPGITKKIMITLPNHIEKDKNKIEVPCLARLNVTVKTGGTVKLSYANGHTGHKPCLGM